MENLSVIPLETGIGVYQISYTGTNPQDTAKIVTAILNAYSSFLESTHEDVGRETRRLIVDAKDELLRKLKAQELAYSKFRAETPLIWREDGTSTNLHQQRQIAIEAQRAAVQLEVSNLESQLDSVKTAVADGENIDGIWRSQPRPFRTLNHLSSSTRRVITNDLWRRIVDSPNGSCLCERSKLCCRC